jgi:hypothetical protein
MVLGKLLGTFNGLVIGTVFGLAAYQILSGEPALTSIGGLLASTDIIATAFFAASAAAIATGFKPIPGVLGGIAGGLVAVPLTIVVPPGISLAAHSLGGAVGGLVVTRLPGLH